MMVSTDQQSPFLYLPLDKLYQISEYLGQKDLSRLIETCNAMRIFFRDEILIREAKHHDSEALRWGCSTGKVRIVKRFLEANTSNAVDQGGATAIVHQIVNHYSTEDLPYPTPLSLAVRKGHPKVVRFLLDHGAKPNTREQSRGRLFPINWAAMLRPSEKRARIIDLLSSHGANLNPRVEYTEWCIDDERLHGHIIPIYSALRINPSVPRHHKNFNSAGEYDGALMSYLCLQENFLKRLLGHGAHANIPSNTDSSPYSDRINPSPLLYLVHQLFLYKPTFHFDVKYATQEEKLAQCGIVQKHAIKCMKMLVKAGADVNGFDINKADFSVHTETPLHRAMEVDDTFPEIPRLLIKLGADVNLTNSAGRSPIQELLILGIEDTRLVDYLIKKGADIHRRGPNGETLLHDVGGDYSRNGHEQRRINVAKVLIKHGCMANVRDETNRFPESKAYDMDLYDLSRYLRGERKRLEGEGTKRLKMNTNKEQSSISKPETNDKNPSGGACRNGTNQTSTKYSGKVPSSKMLPADDGLSRWKRLGYETEKQGMPTSNTGNNAESRDKIVAESSTSKTATPKNQPLDQKASDDNDSRTRAITGRRVSITMRNGLPRERWLARCREL